jgi:hypothetical protein
VKGAAQASTQGERDRTERERRGRACFVPQHLSCIKHLYGISGYAWYQSSLYTSPSIALSDLARSHVCIATYITPRARTASKSPSPRLGENLSIVQQRHTNQAEPLLISLVLPLASHAISHLPACRDCSPPSRGKQCVRVCVCVYAIVRACMRAPLSTTLWLTQNAPEFSLPLGLIERAWRGRARRRPHRCNCFAILQRVGLRLAC